MESIPPVNPIDVTPEDLAAPLIPSRGATMDDEMDITPMIDMTFLLLIYFLVVTTPDMRTVIKLPAARHGDSVSQRTSTVITIGESQGLAAPVYLADGKVAAALLSGEPQSQREAIAQHVRDGLQESNRMDVIIKADRHVSHRDVARVMRAASLVEGIHLHLAVLEPIDD
jgi:biopolymer transport protein ExbD